VKPYRKTFTYPEGNMMHDISCPSGFFSKIWEHVVPKAITRQVGYKGQDGVGTFQLSLKGIDGKPPTDQDRVRVEIETPDAEQKRVLLDATYGRVKQNCYDKDVCCYFPPKPYAITEGCRIVIALNPTQAFILDYDSADNMLHMDTVAKSGITRHWKPAEPEIIKEDLIDIKESALVPSICPICKSVLEEDVAFCQSCGTQVC
jgi:hypothetical protein